MVVYLYAFSLAILSISTQAEFWVEVSLQRVNWQHNCLTTGGCGNPRFRFAKTSITTNEEQTISWPVTETLVEKDSCEFVSFWDEGSPDDLLLRIEVSGIDPTYNFPRICDASQKIHVFPTSFNEPNRNGELRRYESIAHDSPSSKTVIEINAKCFNATIDVKKYSNRCPWCNENSELTVVNQQYSEIEPTFEHSYATRDQLFSISLVALTSIAIASSIAFICIFVAYLRQKRLKDTVNKHKRLEFLDDVYQNGLDEHFLKFDDTTRYETPWDKKYKPLPFIVAKNCDRQQIPALQPSLNSTATKFHKYPLKMTTVGMSHHLSATSSNPDDRRLESV